MAQSDRRHGARKAHARRLRRRNPPRDRRKPPGVSRGVALASAWFSLLLVLGIMIYLKISDDGKVEVGAKFTPSKPAKKPSADPTKSGTAVAAPRFGRL